jgi:deoxyribodipyrimidine photo-lyase
VVEALKAAGLEFRTTFWDQLLHGPGDVRTGAGEPYTVYTPLAQLDANCPRPSRYPPPAGAAAAE